MSFPPSDTSPPAPPPLSIFPLVRYLSLCGALPSRSAAADAIRDGRVRVHGLAATGLSQPVLAGGDAVELDGAAVSVPSVLTSGHVHVLLHKPAGHLCGRRPRRQTGPGTAVPDPRPTVYDLLPSALAPYVQSVGRLDGDTTGVLLFTSDGALHDVLATPGGGVPKIYRATLRRRAVADQDAVDRLRTGVVLPHARGATVTGLLSNVPGQTGVVDLIVTGGYKHQVKLMLRLVGRPLEKLHRRCFCGLELPEDLAEGQCRRLTDAETDALYKHT